jgi:signal transduction histidine kinase/CheY-like chemotaxis protein
MTGRTRVPGRGSEHAAALAAAGKVARLITTGSAPEEVLETLLREFAGIVDAQAAACFRVDGDHLHLVAAHGAATELGGAPGQASGRVEPGTVPGRVALDGRTVQMACPPTDPAHPGGSGLRTVLGVPVGRGGAPLGVLVLGRSAAEPFSGGQIELVEAAAGQALTMLANARLHGELDASTAALDETILYQAVLRDVSRAMSLTRGLGEALEIMIIRGVAMSRSAGGAIWTFDEQQDLFVLQATAGIDPELVEVLRDHPVRAGEDAIGMAADLQKPVEVTDLGEASRSPAELARSVLGSAGYSSLAVAPLLGRQRVVGALAVWRRDSGPFPPGTPTVLEGFARRSVLAAHNAGLYEKVSHQRRLLARSAENKRQLYRLTAALQEPLSLDDQLGRVLDAACQVVEIDRGHMWTLSPDGGALHGIAGSGLSARERTTWSGVQIPLTEAGAMAEACRRRVPLLFDATNPLPAHLMMRPPYSGLSWLRTRSFVVVPMIVRGRVVGVVGADNRPSGRPISPQTVELLQFFASHAAVAISNAQLFADVEDRRRELEVVDRQKSQFLARMSHELRTPLNAVIGYAEILQEEAADRGQESFVADLGKITAGGRHLLELITGVLDLSKIEAGTTELHEESFALEQLVAETRAVIAPLAASNQNRLDVRCAPGIGDMRADRTKVRQILFNLLSNACKFTRSGTVALEVSCADEPEPGTVVFEVSDTGIGLTPDQLGHLFQEFEQATATTAREYGGTGLGLALSQQLCRLMGGHIDVSSELGVGTRFTVHLPSGRLPAGAPTAPPGEPSDRHASGAGTVLVIDDDPDARELLQRLLRKEGLQVSTAGGGKEGLRLAKALHPTAITLDVLMPDLDGWAVLAALKADPELAHIPVILLSITDDRNRGFALGAADYLRKPLDRTALRAVLAEHGTRAGPGHVLIVDGDATSRTLLSQVLHDAGFATVEAATAADALRELDRRPPALLVLDLMLPGSDGFDVLDELRRRSDRHAIPVLVVTASDLDVDAQQRLNGGVARILQKSAHGREELLKEVRDLVVSRIART